MTYIRVLYLKQTKIILPKKQGPLFYSRVQIPPPQMLEHQAQASPMLTWLPSLLLLAGSRRGTCLTLPTNSSLGSLSMAAPGVDVLMPATALAVALVALDEVQLDDFWLEVEPVDELPRQKLTKSTKILELIKTILIVSKRRLCALHVPEEFSHIYLYYVLQ